MSADPFNDLELLALVDDQRATAANPPPPTPSVAADTIAIPGGQSLRVVRPARQARAVYLYFHGGGFQFGSPAMADAANAALAQDLGIATVSAAYRLAPACPHPAASDDCLAAALWLVGNAQAVFGTRRLLIGGGSVGASLAVMTLLRLRDRHGVSGAFAAASLASGNFDFAMTPSQRHAREDHFLSPAMLAQTRTAAFPGLSGEALRDPSISTLYADLGDLPPAVFTVGADDSMLDDTLFMAARWRAAGNAAELNVYPEATHVFLSQPTRMAAAARGRIERFLSRYIE
jgi:acetyl esterase